MRPASWSGIWGFPLSPFTPGGVDLDLLTKAAEFQRAGGVDVLCACGLIAQVEQLTPAEHGACVQAVVAAAVDLPVIATVIATASAVAIATTAVELGVAGLLVIPQSGDFDETRACLSAIAEATPGVPQVLYHRPPLRLDGTQLRQLAELPELAWVKDGHRDVRLFRTIRAAAPKLRWVSAWEDVALAFWAMGCDAFAPASTAYAPEYSRAWLASLNRGDIERARTLLAAHAYPLIDLRLSRPNIDVSVIKHAMRARSLRPGLTRSPAVPLTDPEGATVEQLLARLEEVL